MRKLILSSLLCLMLMPAMAQSGSQEKRISIEEFGAKPDDGKDDTKALRKAAEWCRQNRGVTLYMPQGEYRLRDAEAERLESEVLAGKMGQNPESTIFTPYYPYVKGLDFTGAEDVTIEAYGAVLMCEGWMEPLSIIETKNMTVKGLTIDYKRKPFSEGRVVEIVKGGFVVEFGPQREITDQTPLPRLMLWDNKISGIYRNPFYYAKDEFLGENRVRFKGDLPEYMMGAAVAAPHSFHFRPAVLLLRSENTLLKDLSIHSQCGMGIVGFDSKDIRMDHLSVVPADGYSFSTNTDATHFACCEGLISFDGCMFRGQGDDATNVHGYYHDIEKIEGEDVTLVLKAPTFTHAQVTDVPRVGDKMEVVKISTLEVVDELEVVEVEHEAPATDVKVRLSGKLPEKYNEYYLFNVSKLPRLEFCRSVVWGNLARGV
ncbi:MAG: hypothetical protein II353_02605, partial [Alistipes sp.]|nr:hypothetical protein [Alistipes sp.]